MKRVGESHTVKIVFIFILIPNYLCKQWWFLYFVISHPDHTPSRVWAENHRQRIISDKIKYITHPTLFNALPRRRSSWKDCEMYFSIFEATSLVLKLIHEFSSLYDSPYNFYKLLDKLSDWSTLFWIRISIATNLLQISYIFSQLCGIYSVSPVN